MSKRSILVKNTLKTIICIFSHSKELAFVLTNSFFCALSKSNRTRHASDSCAPGGSFFAALQNHSDLPLFGGAL